MSGAPPRDTLRAMPSNTPLADEPPSTPPEPDAPVPTDEPRRLPIGCHPLVFGVVAATLQMAGILILMRACG